MQACPTCGNQNPESAAFCSQCGTKLLAKPAPQASTVYLQPEVAQQQHRLVVLRPGGADGATFTLLPGKSAIGRGEVQVRLDDPYLSPRHAELSLRGGQLSIVDLQSSNGVYLRLRSETSLTVGDELRLGRQLLRLEPLPEPQFAPDSGRIWGTPDRGARYRMAQLLEGSGVGEALPIAEGEYLFGREEGGMIFPADQSVSRRHAILSVSREAIRVRDLESANGTFLRLRKETTLTPGDHLLVGTQQLRYDLS
jgi:pSer/pThr/pTyr-binding forkhead associated (FHA) protein